MANETNQNKENNKEKKKNNKAGLIIAFVLIILLTNGIQLYFGYQEREEHKEIVEKKDTKINETLAELDTLEKQFEQILEEKKKLGANVDTLEATLKELRADKKNLAQSRNRAISQLKKYKEKVDGYTIMLQQQDEELIKLRAMVEAQHKNITELKHTVVEKEQKIDSLAGQAQELTEKVEQAQVLKAERFRFKGINRRGKERIRDNNEFKDKDLETLILDFKLLENPVAEVETKEVLIQIKEPSGTILYDLDLGGGEFSHDGKNLYYTMEQDVMYRKEGVNVTFRYQKDPSYEWKEGTYTIDVYTEGHKIGESEFSVR